MANIVDHFITFINLLPIKICLCIYVQAVNQGRYIWISLSCGLILKCEIHGRCKWPTEQRTKCLQSISSVNLHIVIPEKVRRLHITYVILLLLKENTLSSTALNSRKNIIGRTI